MHKICARCGVIFEVKDNPKFCSTKCERMFQQSSLTLIKKPTKERTVFANSE